LSVETHRMYTTTTKLVARAFANPFPTNLNETTHQQFEPIITSESVSPLTGDLTFKRYHPLFLNPNCFIPYRICHKKVIPSRFRAVYVVSTTTNLQHSKIQLETEVWGLNLTNKVFLVPWRFELRTNLSIAIRPKCFIHQGSQIHYTQSSAEKNTRPLIDWNELIPQTWNLFWDTCPALIVVELATPHP